MSRENIRKAVVTGASAGIGKAIAGALLADGVDTVLASRSIDRLRGAEADFGQRRGRATCLALDLADPGSIDRFAGDVMEQFSSLDILVHCGGIYARGAISDQPIDQLDALYAANVRGAYALTGALLPKLKQARGDIVFVNSTIVFSNGQNLSAFAASQHALKGIADAVRAEVNEDGVRVLSVYPGRTATPRQRDIHRLEGREYDADKLLQPADVAEVITACLKLPPTAEVMDLRIRPRYK